MGRETNQLTGEKLKLESSVQRSKIRANLELINTRIDLNSEKIAVGKEVRQHTEVEIIYTFKGRNCP